MDLETTIDIISSISIIIASGVGVWGIRRWRKEIRFKRKFELAEQILANVYEAETVIEIIRFPAGMITEGQSRKVGEKEKPKQSDFLNTSFVIKERFLNRNQSFKNLFALQYNVRAVFDENMEKQLNVVLTMPKRIFNVVDKYTESYLHPDYYTIEQKSDIRKKYHQTVYAALTQKEKDPIYIEMKNAVEAIEKECKRLLK